MFKKIIRKLIKSSKDIFGQKEKVFIFLKIFSINIKDFNCDFPIKIILKFEIIKKKHRFGHPNQGFDRL